MLNHKRILITGGTGFFGKKFTETVLQLYPEIREIVILSKDSEKQSLMKQQFSKAPVSFVCGDIADPSIVDRACRDIDLIIHTAAVRLVPEAEAEPWQAITTNIQGAKNLIDSAIRHKTARLLALSTDMASLAKNVYGATKMLSDRLFIAAHKQHPDFKPTIVRLGNILGSTGTVIPFFLRKAREEKRFPVTDPQMTRFMATGEECIKTVLRILSESKGGEIISPKFKSYNILTISQAIDPEARVDIIGLRPGEKLYEEMVTRYESFYTIENKDSYIIVPPYADKEEYCMHYSAVPVPVGFEFNSQNNPDKINVEEMKSLIKIY